MWWLQKRKEGGNVPPNDACSAVTKETCDLLHVGETTSAFRGLRGRKKPGGRSTAEIKAKLGSIVEEPDEYQPTRGQHML